MSTTTAERPSLHADVAAAVRPDRVKQHVNRQTHTRAWLVENLRRCLPGYLVSLFLGNFVIIPTWLAFAAPVAHILGIGR